MASYLSEFRTIYIIIYVYYHLQGARNVHNGVKTRLRRGGARRGPAPYHINATDMYTSQIFACYRYAHIKDMYIHYRYVHITDMSIFQIFTYFRYVHIDITNMYIYVLQICSYYRYVHMHITDMYIYILQICTVRGEDQLGPLCIFASDCACRISFSQREIS